ncbi:hypothetical protein K502DRAFT_165572 [Neoconidiobolus thromboides FSU 785]|nr:hypothetical protein K502DRAFT_165572 [Neoconidiobolus thromboides FSU 785]
MSEENNKNSSPLNEGINPFEDMSSSLSQIKLDTEWTQNNTEKPKILSSPPSESSLKSSSRITIKSVSLSSPDPLFALLPPSSRATRSTPSISKKGSITTIPTNEVKLESNEVLNKPKDNLAKETNPNPEGKQLNFFKI